MEYNWHRITCADCSKEEWIPFHPDESRPVYCRSCHHFRVRCARIDRETEEHQANIDAYKHNWQKKTL